jgi:hypothetical protein
MDEEYPYGLPARYLIVHPDDASLPTVREQAEEIEAIVATCTALPRGWGLFYKPFSGEDFLLD